MKCIYVAALLRNSRQVRVNVCVCAVTQLVEVEEQLLAKRIEMGGINGPLHHRLRLIKRRDQLERKEHVVCCSRERYSWSFPMLKY